MKDRNTSPTKLIKAKEAARYLAICERKLWEIAKEGQIPSINIGRSVRFDINDLDQFIENLKNNPLDNFTEADSSDLSSESNSKIKELIAIGASVSANCHPCLKFHLNKAKKLGIEPEEIKSALQIGVMVRGGAAQQMDELISDLSKKFNLDFSLDSPG